MAILWPQMPETIIEFLSQCPAASDLRAILGWTTPMLIHRKQCKAAGLLGRHSESLWYDLFLGGGDAQGEKPARNRDISTTT